MSNDIKFKYPAMATVADIDKAISGAIQAAKTMKAKVQYGAIGCMILGAMEGNDEESGLPYPVLAIQKANYLVEQVGAGVKGEGLVKFLVYMCGFKVNPASKKDGFIRTSSPEWIRENLEAAKSKPWYDYAPPNPFKGFNFAEELSALMKKADNAVLAAETDEKKAEKIMVDRDMLDVLHHLISGTPIKQEHALQLVTRLIPDEGDEVVEDAPVPMVVNC